MEIETLPIITHLERFVQGLPKEHRAEVYRLAESFYHVGAGDGVMAGALSTARMFGGSGETAKPEEDKSRQYHNYFERKISEAELEAQNGKQR